MRRQRSAGRWAAGLVLAVLATGRAEPPAPAIEPEAEQLLRHVAAGLGGRNAFAVNVSASVRIEAEGIQQTFTSDSVFAVRKPNQAALVLKSGLLGGTVVCDGTNLFTHVPMLDQYTVEPAPADLGGMVDAAWDGMSAGFPLLQAFLAEDPYAAFMEGVFAARVVGSETVDGVACARVRLEQAELDWDAWITSGEEARLWRVVPDMTRLIHEAAAFDEELAGHLSAMHYEVTVDFRGWRTEDDFTDDQFVFTPPPGAERVDSFLLDWGSTAPETEKEPHRETIPDPAKE